MSKGYLNFFIFIAMMVSLYFLIPSHENQNCEYEERMLNRRIAGVVKRRFIDSSNHSSPTILVQDLKSGKIDTIYFFLDNSNVFHLTKESDTLSKALNSLKVYKVSHGELQLLDEIDADCEKKSAP